MLSQIETGGCRGLLLVIQKDIDLHSFANAVIRERDVCHQIGAHYDAFKNFKILQLCTVANDTDLICWSSVALGTVILPIQTQYTARLCAKSSILKPSEVAFGNEYLVVDQLRNIFLYLNSLVDGVGYSHVHPGSRTA